MNFKSGLQIVGEDGVDIHFPVGYEFTLTREKLARATGNDTGTFFVAYAADYTRHNSVPKLDVYAGQPDGTELRLQSHDHVLKALGIKDDGEWIYGSTGGPL